MLIPGLASSSRFHLAILALLLSIAASGCEFSVGGGAISDSSKKSVSSAPVETAPGLIEDVEKTLSISTDLEARDSIDLTARVSGVVTEVLAEEGAEIAEGSLILRLDPTDLDLALKEAKVLLQEAKTLHASAELGLKEVASGTELARVSLDRAKAERRRLERLLGVDGRRLGSEEELEKSRFAEEEAIINHDKSRLVLEKMQMTLEMEKQGVAKAALALEKATLDLARSEITSPLDGRVKIMDLRPGELVASGSAVATVIRTHPLLAWVRVPQSRIGELRLGMAAVVTSEASRGSLFSGEVTAISPAVDPAEGTLRVRVEVEDPEERLRAGAFATCTLILGIHESALMIPKSARFFEGNQSIIFVVRQGKAVRVKIEPGLQIGDRLEVLSSSPPIFVEDRFVIRGQARLRDGDPVDDVRVDSETIVEEKSEVSDKGDRG